jgi:CRP/FNR family transcriptional regulator, cyclic AMP receptor protein
MRAASHTSKALVPRVFQNFSSRKLLNVAKNDMVFSQGARADALYYLVSGRIRYSFTSANGKDAIICVFSDGDFFGERCLTSHSRFFATASALTDSVVLRISSEEAKNRLSEDSNFGALLFANVLERTHQYEEALALHLVDNSEHRLASILLRLADHYKSRDGSLKPIFGISQSQLAEMVGTTRSRVNTFMNKFRQLGFVTYTEDEIVVRPNLANILKTNGR